MRSPGPSPRTCCASSRERGGRPPRARGGECHSALGRPARPEAPGHRDRGVLPDQPALDHLRGGPGTAGHRLPLHLSHLAPSPSRQPDPLVGQELRPRPDGAAHVVEDDDLDGCPGLRPVLCRGHLRLRPGAGMDPHPERRRGSRPPRTFRWCCSPTCHGWCSRCSSSDAWPERSIRSRCPPHRRRRRPRERPSRRGRPDGAPGPRVPRALRAMRGRGRRLVRPGRGVCGTAWRPGCPPRTASRPSRSRRRWRGRSPRPSSPGRSPPGCACWSSSTCAHTARNGACRGAEAQAASARPSPPALQPPGARGSRPVGAAIPAVSGTGPVARRAPPTSWRP